MNELDEMYEKMRPYRDQEVKEALGRILGQKEFMAVLQYIFPERSVAESLKEMRKVNKVCDFQGSFSGPAVASILKQTATEFTFSGIENINKETSYLFISNHRDIVLDSAILQYVLRNNGHRTTQITFGSNLMSSQFIIDIGKVNKMFTFYRGGSRVDIYRNALIHSAYIKKVITEENESIWIAQRDGRTKDGDDKTQLSLLKMLTIKEKDHVQAIQRFNIVPISISYEIEPCDILKVRELVLSSKSSYVKIDGEDFRSVIGGIVGKKGKVNLAFGKPINEFIKTNIADLNNDNVHQKICTEMDRQIYQDFQLTRFNYVSYDIMNMSQKYLGDKYNEEDLIDVMNHIEESVEGISDVDKKELKDALIKLYAMPVCNVKSVMKC